MMLYRFSNSMNFYLIQINIIYILEYSLKLKKRLRNIFGFNLGGKL